jgi:hypothetical protein
MVESLLPPENLGVAATIPGDHDKGGCGHTPVALFFFFFCNLTFSSKKLKKIVLSFFNNFDLILMKVHLLSLN